MTKNFIVLVALLAAMFALAACGSDGETNQQAQTASNGEQFNGADVAFATEMIQHHAQALQMVDLTMGRDIDPEVLRLSEDIRAAQAPEIEQMSDWLSTWDKPIPATVRDHVNAHGDADVEMDADMPGLMSHDQISELEAAQGAQFQAMWLKMMIEHHRGAIEMAQGEQSDGTWTPAIELAGSIESSQQKEIDTMERLLRS